MLYELSMPERRKEKRIIIVGGGTAGYITALILKQKFQEKIDIKVIRSKNIGIIGVGEGSTEQWADFLTFVEIKPSVVIKECGATFKFGIMFEGWGEKKYLHSINKDLDVIEGQEHISYLNFILNNKKFDHEFIYENKFPDGFFPTQFHFDTHKLNIFLEKICGERDIKIIDDIIEHVEVSLKGIDYIESKNKKYEADFFIDCTGFKRLLVSKLGAKWKSYKKYLKVNSAITFQTPEEENYNSWTLAKAMKFGWRFKIPVQGRCGNGYIFSDKYTTPEKAKMEVEKELGHKINIGKHIKFDPGRLDRMWIKNCVAIGLSANFVEPLEATSIGTSIQQAYLLMHNLTSSRASVREQYNNQVESIMNNIRDFIYLHYFKWHKHNWFWKNFDHGNAPPSLKKMLSIWDKRLPINDDIKGSDYKLFRATNFIQVLDGINFYRCNRYLPKQYDFLSRRSKDKVKNCLDKNLKQYTNLKYKTHKEVIKNINESTR